MAKGLVPSPGAWQEGSWGVEGAPQFPGGCLLAQVQLPSGSLPAPQLSPEAALTPGLKNAEG